MKRLIKARATVNIFAVSYFYNNHNKFIILNTINNTICPLTYTVFVLTRQFFRPGPRLGGDL